MINAIGKSTDLTASRNIVNLRQDFVISVIIVASRQDIALKRLLCSILPFLRDDIEVIVMLNGVMKNNLHGLQDGHKNIKYIVLEGVSVGEAKNRAIRQSSGDILYFLDDDIIVESDIFQIARNNFELHSEIGVIGGPNLTPSNSSFWQRCCGLVLCSVFGSAHVRFRYKQAEKAMLVDDKALIGCNLAVRRSVIKDINKPFNETVIRNEENMLLEILKKRGVKMLYMPELFVCHERRKSLVEFLKQIFSYGYGRGQQTVRMPQSVSIFNLLPGLFILYLFAALVFHANPLYWLPVWAYLILDAVFSVEISLISKKIYCGLISLFLFPFLHIAYGSGFLCAFLYTLCLRRRN